MRWTMGAVLACLFAGCGGQTGGGGGDGADAEVEIEQDGVVFEVREDGAADVLLDLPGLADATAEILAACEAGEGCFLDPCEENQDCQSGFCLEHMGEGVCSQLCTEECPPGWLCKAVDGAGPDLIYACVSQVANLCRPCATGADCKSPGGSEDVCVDYGPVGSFCGGTCEADEDCPWGFACREEVSVEGVASQQCVAEAGTCPCTGKSVMLGLSTPCEVTNDQGTCIGKRVCTDEGLSPCDAAAPLAESCNGLDDDCDDDVDEPGLVDGKLVELCDDENACTEDACTGADGCTHAALSNVECVDGNSCTVADHCEAGVCVGTPVDCDDENPCTDDSCDYAGGCLFEMNSASCDDGDPCTVVDACAVGLCVGYAVDCECHDDEDCASLEDGDLCNGTLVCDTSKLPHLCVVEAGTEVTCPEPEGTDAPCLKAACDAETGECSLMSALDGVPCDDGDACTLMDACVAGACTGGLPANCVDDNPCTDDLCDPAEGCTHPVTSAPCSDGDVCTTGDECLDGECVGGAPLICGDGNPCTDDSCDSAIGCTYVANSADCDDLNACTTGDHCEGGACLPTGDQVCDDGNICTTDMCTAADGCVFQLNEAPCDDQDVCTTWDHCHLGDCISAGQLSCTDSNPCTDDSCDPISGCVFAFNSASCDDLDACTTIDLCVQGACAGGEAMVCDDAEPCTDDACDPQTGCVFTDNTLPCDDDDLCTTGDVCVQGGCVGGPQLQCTTDNPCQTGSCQPDAGCVFSPKDGSCDDGDPCTEGDLCLDGTCAPGQGTMSCDDGDPCTGDECVEDAGCVHTDAADQTSCGDGMWCQGGECVGIQGGVFCFEGPEKAWLTGEEICQQFYGLPCGPAATVTYHSPGCTGAIHDHGRHCWEDPLDPYDKASALITCGQ